MRQLFLLIAGIISIGVFSGCNTDSSKMKLGYINPQVNTFSFINMKSGETLAYQKLIYKDREVVDTYCMGGANKSVILAFDRHTIVRDGDSVKINGGEAITGHAVMKYKLEGGTLTILSLE
ncbi:MAG: hypothetical protein LBQ60_15980 [Bacteroidales bacterium]|jgi:hypothetical protein|nr:hypothetical protein [Bacteroidales bacterium]